MLLLIETVVMCFLLLVVCVVGIANGPVGLVVLYEKDVQQRVIELGYTTREKIRNSLIVSSLAMFLPVFTVTPWMVYGINGAKGFWEGFWQMTVILWGMGLFDRFFIDWYWVGRTKAWIIPGTEDLRPYITAKDKKQKWLMGTAGMAIAAALLSGVMTLIL